MSSPVSEIGPRYISYTFFPPPCCKFPRKVAKTAQYAAVPTKTSWILTLLNKHNIVEKVNAAIKTVAAIQSRLRDPHSRMKTGTMTTMTARRMQVILTVKVSCTWDVYLTFTPDVDGVDLAKKL